jgi:hypothetical protein
LFGTTALLLVRGSFSGADDGIRTRDPHFGKVAGLASLTGGVAPTCSVSCVFSFACNAVVSGRCAFVHGTPTGPLRHEPEPEHELLIRRFGFESPGAPPLELQVDGLIRPRPSEHRRITDRLQTVSGTCRRVWLL